MIYPDDEDIDSLYEMMDERGFKDLNETREYLNQLYEENREAQAELQLLDEKEEEWNL